jgi:hypothetical protein
MTTIAIFRQTVRAVVAVHAESDRSTQPPDASADRDAAGGETVKN